MNFSLGNYEEAARYNELAVSRNPEALRHRIFLAATYSELGRIEDAEWEIEEALLLLPELTLSSIKHIAPYRDPDTNARRGNALQRAGLPE